MSSLNVNSTSRDGQQTRGVYKLMSLEDYLSAIGVGDPF